MLLVKAPYSSLGWRITGVVAGFAAFFLSLWIVAVTLFGRHALVEPLFTVLGTVVLVAALGVEELVGPDIRGTRRR
jgi:hypothetical protein